MVSDAQKRASKKWNDANKKKLYDQIAILCPKGERESFKAAAAAAGVSLSAYIMQAVREKMSRDGAAGKKSGGPG